MTHSPRPSSNTGPAFSHRDRVGQCLARIADPAGEGSKAFLTVWNEEARIAAESLDRLNDAGYRSALDGLPVSIKDLLDVKGEVTRAAARPLDDTLPAREDAPVVARLKQAGAILIGRTNMTPFAYSVVGLNGHFGTPGNPVDRTRTPGGSSSGAAVSVATGMTAAAIGSDTVGSIRVPAALCGVVGVKPTQRAVPLDGAFPLSTTLDSIGPLARTVEDCARVLAVISGGQLQLWQRTNVEGVRLALPGGRFLESLDTTVSGAFERACRRLSAAGALIRDQTFEALEAAADGSLARTIQSVEAFTTHEALLARRGGDYDPRIRARILQGREVSAADYVRAIRIRSGLMAAFMADMAEVDALILPTVPVVAPRFTECESDEDGVRIRLLRNTAPFNVLDACAVTLPIQDPGELPVGLMLAAPPGRDAQLIDIARAIEAALRT
ncbi:amidase [Mesorhizobium sp. B2-4-2]|uniref:amidase n=1 Tax=unclassified Mesorhizobium TaxID=325217 RepID=UPI0011268961|nr:MULTISPECIES: amidase [unclassified Mesorhizobium]MBZ9955575.1 amidase [Mesorhizobium sp. BR1-1-15]MBZ9958750.1 amidase [Mesorhizobium sp. BR1-1-14]TPL46049.1 amidase [Mesorhizobium sp. B2-4-4]TPL60275.1 amidase [Mesorhizobium sp. B2-4-2]TPN55831.1 amidase [Mesorhizobium sp. B1-1-4]